MKLSPATAVTVVKRLSSDSGIGESTLVSILTTGAYEPHRNGTALMSRKVSSGCGSRLGRFPGGMSMHGSVRAAWCNGASGTPGAVGRQVARRAGKRTGVRANMDDDARTADDAHADGATTESDGAKHRRAACGARRRVGLDVMVRGRGGSVGAGDWGVRAGWPGG